MLIGRREQINSSPYAIQEAASPGIPRVLFPWGLAFYVKKNLLSYISRSILFLCSLRVVNIFRGHGNYAPNIWYVLFFFSPSSGSQLVSSHLNTMSNSYIFGLFLFFLYIQGSQFFYRQRCRKHKQTATVLWGICDWKRALITNARYQSSGTSSRRGTQRNAPLKGNLKVCTTRIGEQGRKKGRWTL